MDRLLILDDEPAIASTVAMIAQSAGFEARFTTEPEEFLRLVDDWQPSHIALDLVMPEMDGVQVMASLGRRGCRASIIITSGVGSRVLDAAGRSAAEHGLVIAGMLSKPFSPAALRALLLDSKARLDSDAGMHQAGATAQAEATLDPADLRRALGERQLFLVYQPQINADTGVVTGFEALVRWRHPQLGTVMPDRFIHMAESSGLIDGLTDQVLELGLGWLSRNFPGRNNGASGDEVSLSVNISAASLGDRDFVEDALQACGRHGIDPGRLILELTETSAMCDPVATLDLLTRMRMKGFQLSIDDFGTGFSSMLQLARLPFSELKVDKSFVMTALHSVESRAVVRSVVELGRSLGLRTVAEGVEDVPTLEFLKGIGCDLAQGYAIARPMPAEEAADWAAARHSPDSVQRSAQVPATRGDPLEAIRWTQGLATGFPDVDSGHQRLLELLHRLGVALVGDDGDEPAEVNGLFAEFVDYAVYHFHDEEAMMAAQGLDARHIELHRAEHAGFISELLQLRAAADAQAPEAMRPGLMFIAHWLTFHILGVDRSMGRQVTAVREGSSADAAFRAEQMRLEDAGQPMMKAVSGLVRELSQRNHALREITRVLENRITERTTALSDANRQLAAVEMTDPLTGIPNRRHALRMLARHWEETSTEGRPLACLMVDTDGFRSVNERWGHDAGDAVLEGLAARLQHTVRTDDLVCRLGGDVFLVIAPATAEEGALLLAEKICREVAGLRIPVGVNQWQGSVGIGVAARDPSMEAPRDLIKLADEALRSAKRAGRNAIATRHGAVLRQQPE